MNPEETGWIEWRGGDSDPEAAGTVVECRFRSGAVDSDFVEHWAWDHIGSDSDIIAYRLVKP